MTRKNKSFKHVFAAFVGTSLEWHDFFAYGTAAALVFPAAFFPSEREFSSVLASLAVFGVGFFARPVGGMLFGHLGDRFGRKRCFGLTLVLMGLSTLAIGCLPTYSSIGIVAPICLVALRLVQGIALGGEYGAAVLFITENVDESRLASRASWTQAGVPLGMLLASAGFAIADWWFGDSQFHTVGWRIPFILGGLVAGLGVYVRTRLEETAEFAKISPIKRPLVATLVRAPREVVGGVLIRLPENASYYLATVFLVAYGARVGLLHAEMLRALLLGSACQFVGILLVGRACDVFGTLRITVFGLCAIAPAFYWLMYSISRAEHVWLGYVVYLGVAHPLLYAPQSALFAQSFPVQFRYSGISLVTQASAVLAGGVAPFVGAYITRGREVWSLGLYVVALSCLGAVGVILLASRKRAQDSWGVPREPSGTG